MSVSVNSDSILYFENSSLDNEPEAKRARVAHSPDDVGPYQIAQHAIADSAKSKTSYTFPSVSLNFFNIFSKAKDELTKDQRKERLLAAIREDAQPEFFQLHEEFIVEGALDTDVSNAILLSSLELPSDIVSLIPENMVEDFLQKQLASDHKNYSLIAAALTLKLEKENLQDVLGFLKALLETNDTRGVNFLIDLIHSEIPKKVRPSSAYQIASQLGYVAEYCRWMTFNYHSEEFFDSKTFFSTIFKENNLEKIADAFNSDNLEHLAQFREHGAKMLSFEKAFEKKIPPYFLKNKQAFEFLQLTDSFAANEYYGHGFPLDKTTGEPFILVKGCLTPISKVLEKFTLEKSLLGSKAVFRIQEKDSKTTFLYLEDGLVPHDDVTGICIVDKRPPSGTYTISICSLDHGDSSSPEGIKRLLSTHSWVRLEDAEGNVYSVGLWGDGKLHSPDFYHRTLLPKNLNSINVSQEGFDAILESIKEEQRLRYQEARHFNLLKDNCSCFAAKIAKEALESSPSLKIGPEILSADLFFGSSMLSIPSNDELKELATSQQNLSVINSFETRIKCFFAAQELVDAVFKNKKESLEFLKRLETILGGVDLAASKSSSTISPEIIQKIEENIDLLNEASLVLFKQFSHLKCPFNAINNLSLFIKACKNIEDPNDVKILMSFFSNLCRELIVDIQRHNKAACVNKIFNFELNILQSLKNFNINHPYILFENLKSDFLNHAVKSESKVKKI